MSWAKEKLETLITELQAMIGNNYDNAKNQFFNFYSPTREKIINCDNCRSAPIVIEMQIRDFLQRVAQSVAETGSGNLSSSEIDGLRSLYNGEGSVKSLIDSYMSESLDSASNSDMQSFLKSDFKNIFEKKPKRCSILGCEEYADYITGTASGSDFVSESSSRKKLLRITRRKLVQIIKEAHGLSKSDADKVKALADETDDPELERILKFIVKSNVEVDKTQDVTKMKKESRVTTKHLERIIREEIESALLKFI